jgi:hypothetical protein
MVQLLLPRAQINRIRYFTAIVQARPGDPAQPDRQRMYIRALETIPGLTVHYGRFLSSIKRARLVTPIAGVGSYVDVHKTEEKGSDVNLAAYLLMDCSGKDFEQAVIVSNDSDLILPVRYVLQQGYKVGMLNPHPKPAVDFVTTASFVRQIRKGVLSASQFPTTLADGTGTITKPAKW